MEHEGIVDDPQLAADGNFAAWTSVFVDDRNVDTSDFELRGRHWSWLHRRVVRHYVGVTILDAASLPGTLLLSFQWGPSSHCGLGSSSVPPTSEFSVLKVDFTSGAKPAAHPPELFQLPFPSPGRTFVMLLR